MTLDTAPEQLPASCTDLVAEKSDLLLQANMHEAQQQFDEAPELFAKSARIEAKLATTAQKHERLDTALIHLVSEMSCWVAAGDTYRALSRGQQVLTIPSLTSAQRTHIRDFIVQLNQRRRTWMESWGYQYPATA